ncbi:MAG: ABC transporter ATP-binding protein, partial [Deferribacterales bacterium]|nr:ABC transporter ATP-binding protein [Deferribacterales bacterium]
METSSLVSLQKVTKRYGHVTAVKDLSLDINEGSFTAIFGPNGAGKSTLLKILSNQTRPTSGEILYSGVPAKKLDDSFRSKFGVISHQPFVYENLSALENLEFYASLYGVKNPRARAEELLKKVDLYPRRSDP